MIGVILCTHSTFADGLKNAVEMIAGEQENFDSVCFMNGDDPDELAERLTALAQKYKDQNMPYCFIVDLYAATPFNTSLRVALENEGNIITGANLPLLLDILLSRMTFEGENIHDFLEYSMNNVKESMQVIDPQTLFNE